MSNIENFITKYGPRNPEKGEKIVRDGVYGAIPFTVIETSNTYSVQIYDKKRFFSNAWEAARWVDRKANGGGEI